MMPSARGGEDARARGARASGRGAHPGDRRETSEAAMQAQIEALNTVNARLAENIQEIQTLT
jgi:hypothetical protein